jgi:cellulose synthase/poly-beta-1,6-N-acetylglucosamine synthase-like glycosyltransferase
MREALIGWVTVFVLLIQPLFLLYFVLYNSYTLWLIALSARQVRRRVAGHFIEDLDLIDEGDLTKPLTLIMPAYNEEVTIVDSVSGLVQCDYPRFEIVVVNDVPPMGLWSGSNAHFTSGAPIFPTGRESVPPRCAPPTRPRCRFLRTSCR